MDFSRHKKKRGAVFSRGGDGNHLRLFEQLLSEKINFIVAWLVGRMRIIRKISAQLKSSWRIHIGVSFLLLNCRPSRDKGWNFSAQHRNSFVRYSLLENWEWKVFFFPLRAFHAENFLPVAEKWKSFFFRFFFSLHFTFSSDLFLLYFFFISFPLIYKYASSFTWKQLVIRIKKFKCNWNKIQLK